MAPACRPAHAVGVSDGIFLPTRSRVSAYCVTDSVLPGMSLGRLRVVSMMVRNSMWVLVCTVALSGCGAAKSYRLPMAAAQASSTFAPLASCAQARGHEFAEHPDSLNVKFDDATWVQFMIQNDAYNMVIVVDDKVVPAAELDARFGAAKAEGDAMWSCAADTQRGMLPTVVPAAGTPAPVVAAPAGNFTGSCLRLVTCYMELARDLCAGNSDPGCQGSFEVKIEADDQAVCDATLTQAALVAQPLMMVKAGYVLPAACK